MPRSRCIANSRSGTSDPVRFDLIQSTLIQPTAAGGRAVPWLLALLALTAWAGSWWYLAPESVPGPLKAVLPVSPSANPLLYKWRDGKGQLHVTDTAPTDRPYETLRYNPNTNVVPSVVPPPGKKP